MSDVDYLWDKRFFSIGFIHLFAHSTFFTGEILMTAHALVQISLFFLILMLLAKPLGIYMAKIYAHYPVWLSYEWYQYRYSANSQGGG